MNNDDFSIGAVVGFGLALLLLTPWWLWLAIGVGCVIPWYKRWRFKLVEPADKMSFLDFSTCGYGRICDVEHMMYLGTLGDDDTIRWWYWREDGTKDYLVPQAVDNGEVYWDKKLRIENPRLLRHLHGFYEMGNEWPAYYKMINKQVEHIKKRDHEQEARQRRAEKHAARHAVNMIKHPFSFEPETIKAVESDLPRADYAIEDPGTKYAITAAMTSDAQLLDLQETVKELEQEIKGRCPTLDISVKP